MTTSWSRSPFRDSGDHVKTLHKRCICCRWMRQSEVIRSLLNDCQNPQFGCPVLFMLFTEVVGCILPSRFSQFVALHLLLPQLLHALLYRLSDCAPSAKTISVRAEWLRQSGRNPSELSETPRWRINPCPPSVPRVALHIALRSPFRRFFSLCWSPIINRQSGVVVNCDHMSEWVLWGPACIGIAMQWVTLRKSLLAFLLQ